MSIFCRASGTEDWSAIPRSLFASSRYRRVSNGRMRCGPSIIDPRECHATPTAVGLRQFPAAAVSIFGREDLAANTDPASLRRVVRSRLDRIADLAKKPPDKPGTGRNLERGGCPLHMRRPRPDRSPRCRRPQNRARQSGRTNAGPASKRNTADSGRGRPDNLIPSFTTIRVLVCLERTVSFSVLTIGRCVGTLDSAPF